jgi:hypothetical protein
MENMDYKIVLGILATAMTIWAHIPYFKETLKGKNKPHIFTWIIWTLLTFIATAAQIVGGAGPGAWVTFVTGLICVAITLAALKHGEKRITRSDWIIFIASLSAIPLWLLTSDPLLSVILVTAIDISAVYPTFRKSWIKPFEENTYMYGFNIPRHIFSIAAIQTISPVTAIYPAGLLVMNIVMYFMLKTRRVAVSKKLA